MRLDLNDRIVMEAISKDLKILDEEESRVEELWRRNAVPPPTILLIGVDERRGRGVLMRVNPLGVASESWAKVEEGEIQVSVIAKRLIWFVCESSLRAV